MYHSTHQQHHRGDRLEAARRALNLPAVFTDEQLRYNYKVLARQLHPDKCGRRISAEQANATFQVLTDSYRTLQAELRARQSDRPFDELRKEARGASGQDGAPAPAIPVGSEKRKFDLRHFNDLYEAERMGDGVRDGGYTQWMRQHDPDGPFSDARPNRQLIVYTEPEPVTVSRKGCVAYTELGVERVDDYSRGDAAKHAIQYTDYRVAHTTTKLVDEDSMARAEGDFRSLEHLQQHRSAMTYVMSAEEAAALAEAKRALKEEEEMRVRAQRALDERIAGQYDRVHRKLLGSAPSK